jgi:CHAD domain-containing protein
MKARKVKGLDPQGTLRDNAARTIGTRLDELRAFADEALEQDASEAQHDMRIAAKRLRYLLEVMGPCFGSDADKARRAAKDLQTVLGDIHDCDVMLPRVRRQVEALQASDARSILLRSDGAADLETAYAHESPHREAYRGLALLSVHLLARRALLFERFRDLWQAQASKGIWAALERAL